MKNATNYLYKATKNVLRYVKGGNDAGIEFMKEEGNFVLSLIRYCAADWGQEKPARK